jgi:16S rRNA (cytosine967-C5)-methyltransferase
VIAPARRAAFAALVEITRGRADLDDALDRTRQTLSDVRDVALLRELVTGTLRWQSRLDWRLAPLSRVAIAKLDVEVLVTLRMAAYQLEHLDRVPASAVVHDAVALVRAAKKSSAAGLVNAVLRALTRAARAEPPAAPAGASRAEVAAALAVSTAHPAWLIERWLARESRQVVEAWLAFDNDPPPMTLRVNPLGGASRDEVAARLSADGIVTTRGPRGGTSGAGRGALRHPGRRVAAGRARRTGAARGAGARRLRGARRQDARLRVGGGAGGPGRGLRRPRAAPRGAARDAAPRPRPAGRGGGHRRRRATALRADLRRRGRGRAVQRPRHAAS